MLELLKSDAKLRVVLKEFPVLGEASMEAAREKAYEGLKGIRFEGMAFRGDIARRQPQNTRRA